VTCAAYTKGIVSSVMHGSVQRFRLAAKSPATLISLSKNKQFLDVQFFVDATDDKENVQEEEEEEKWKRRKIKSSSSSINDTKKYLTFSHPIKRQENESA
jgi:hypothetical protein